MSELDGAEKEKKPKKAETAENKSAEAENNESIIKVLYGMRHTVTRIVGEFARHIRTDTVYIKADISSDDAAKCALALRRRVAVRILHSRIPARIHKAA